jgi:hypothetical protein
VAGRGFATRFSAGAVPHHGFPPCPIRGSFRPGMGPTLKACSSASRSKSPRSALGRLSTGPPSLFAATSVAPAPRQTFSVWSSVAGRWPPTRSHGSSGEPSPVGFPSSLAVAVRAARAVRAAFTGASHEAEAARSTLPSSRRRSRPGFREPAHRPGRASGSRCLRARVPRFPSSARAGSATAAHPRSPRWQTCGGSPRSGGARSRPLEAPAPTRGDGTSLSRCARLAAPGTAAACRSAAASHRARRERAGRTRVQLTSAKLSVGRIQRSWSLSPAPRRARDPLRTLQFARNVVCYERNKPRAGSTRGENDVTWTIPRVHHGGSRCALRRARRLQRIGRTTSGDRRQ